ncbi:hypothetical protein BHE74_00018547 [Ensete ventricosum]|nr:hypothetical protein GW17_00009053 [Ensete ventricosum]RWW73569.1 hypothetical protein BHE74_00018547 [Ensete ventricosum]RZR98049.1 hypothetical protein BHM03_00027349 [Ensete ventricosum]
MSVNGQPSRSRVEMMEICCNIYIRGNCTTAMQSVGHRWSHLSRRDHVGEASFSRRIKTTDWYARFLRLFSPKKGEMTWGSHVVELLPRRWGTC